MGICINVVQAGGISGLYPMLWMQEMLTDRVFGQAGTYS